LRRVLIVGAGQAGLQLALGLQSRGYEVTLMSNRTADEIRSGRVTSTQVMFHTALQHERDLGLNSWEGQAPRIEGLGVSVADPDGARAIDWLGSLDAYAQSVDQRVKMAGWMETFAARGGRLVIHGASVADLDYFARAYDLVLVAAGKGELVALFGRDAARSPYTAPKRTLAVSYVHGLAPADSPAEPPTVRLNMVPGAGELITIPALTTSGRCDILFWEALPGGPLDVFDGVTDPAEHLALTLGLMRRHLPWVHERARHVELTDAGATLTGAYTPVVRHPVAELPSGGLVLGVADVVVANDPLTGQGANCAAKCAASYLAAITDRADLPFDRPWMQSAFDAFWSGPAGAAHATKWTNALLGPPPPHLLAVIGAGAEYPGVADRFANGFDDPADFEAYLYEPERTAAYLASASAASVG
jgi:hypothetical protein